MQSRLLFVLRLAFLLPAGWVPSGSAAPAAAEEIDAQWLAGHYTKSEFRIPMRDGVRLHTSVYTPKDSPTNHPILLVRTPYGVRPYGSDRYPDPAGSFSVLARDRFIFAYQDVRGRNGSQGEFMHVRPVNPRRVGPADIDESTDAWDTIDWLVKNVPGNSGRVGMFGISYPGFYASMGMIGSHPALRAVSPQAPIADWFIGDDFHHNGAVFLPHAFNFLARFGQKLEEPTRETPRDFDHRTPDGYDFFLRLGPLANADETHFKGRIAFWSDLASHPNYDAFWQARNIRPHLRDVRCAVLTVGGWYDAEDLFGALETYRATERQNPGITNLLVMGPWAHGDWGRGTGERLGAVEFRAKTAEFYREQIELPFFRHFLKDDPAFGLPEAFVFETGTHQWRRFDAWPPRGATPATWYLQPDGGLGPERPGDGDPGFDEYLSDPARPVPFIANTAIGMTPDYMTSDQRFASTRPDVLVYATPPLEDDLTLAGPVRVALHASTTGTDADWVVKLIDVYHGDHPDPDPNPAGVRMGGFQQLVRGEPMRGRFRKSFERPEPFEPGRVEPVAWTLPDVFHTFRRGHRVMIQIQSTWFPLVDRNPQTFVPDIWQAKPGDFQKATHRIHRAGPMASSISFQILPRTAATATTTTSTTAIATSAAAAAIAPPAASAPRPVDFVADIQPILARHCVECHGPDKQKGGFRVDVKSSVRKGGDSGLPGIVPGDTAASHLLTRIAGLDPEERMPPKGDLLDVGTAGVLRAWIEQGAPWPDAASAELADPSDGWALQSLIRPAVPPAGGGAPSSHPVDAFIRARLAEEGGRPSPEADRRTLIRRVTFDLTGLPPTPEEVAAFVADPDPGAYEKWVDRLLASPHYGERWARTWLDIVHYGDTHGYDKDKPRNTAWPYRDYVIRAFNEDKPYRRFVEEQIAGDVLHPDTADGIEALGFIASGPWDFIGHEEVPESKTDGKIARHLDRDDMVSNAMGTFASQTIHCAQCHDHKFDPIPQEDYYALQAVFAAVDRTERRYHRDPALNGQRTSLEARIRELSQQERELRSEITRLGGDPLKQLEEQIRKSEQAAREGQPAEYGFHSEIAAADTTLKWVQVDLGRAVALDHIVLAPTRDTFNNIGDGFGFPPRFRVEVADDPAFQQGVRVVADRTGADVPNPGIGRLSFPVAGPPARYVRVTATRLAPRQNDFIFALAELEAHAAGGTNVARGAEVTALDSIEAPARWARSNLTDGRAPGAAPAEDLAQLRAERLAWIAQHIPTATRDALASTTNALAAARRDLESMPKPLVTFVGAVHHGGGNFRGTGPDGGRPRPIHVLARGDVRKPGALAAPGALQCVRQVPARFPLSPEASEGERRAAFAGWLTGRDNPLTWRSIVNRIWQQRFGRGLVDTPNDFGRMGGRPSHPGLLDWLAVEFRDGGQSFKTLDRLLVTSATYRQGSRLSGGSTADNKTATATDTVTEDTENHLLAHRLPRRLEAEAVRDSILAVSGRLDLAMYGPGFQDFVIEKPEHSPHYQYHLHDPDDPRSHRRSVYRFLVRSQQEPFMTALDCADPSMRVDRRNETLTPLQALALLNSRLTVAMAAHFARRIEHEAGPGTPARIERAVALAFQRSPTPAEQADLNAYADRHGLAATCRLLFNLNEFVFVD